VQIVRGVSGTYVEPRAYRVARGRMDRWTRTGVVAQSAIETRQNIVVTGYAVRSTSWYRQVGLIEDLQMMVEMIKKPS